MGLFGSSKKTAPPPPRPVVHAPPPPSMDEVIFKMKFTAKQVGRQALKTEKQVSLEERKSKEALQKGNIDGARIHAENAIRNKNQAVSYMKLQSQLEAVTSKLQSQQLRAQVTNELAGVTQNLDLALGSMDMAKISEVMEKFVGQSEDLDMQTKYMDSAIGESTSMSTPQSEVDNLLMKIAEENNLEVREQLNASTIPSQLPSSSGVRHEDKDDIEARFAALSGGNPGPRY